MLRVINVSVQRGLRKEREKENIAGHTRKHSSSGREAEEISWTLTRIEISKNEYTVVKRS